MSLRDRFGSSVHADDYGKGVVELADGLDSETQADQLIAQVRGTFSSPKYQPPLLPLAALEVHRLSQLEDVKLNELLATLEKDPLLAARVLRAANSSAYGGGQPLHSLYNAVMRLGMKSIASIVWEVALNMRVFRSKDYQLPMDEIRRHSTVVAHLARMVAKETSIPLEYAFLCGLLHDVGAAAVLLLLGDGSAVQPAPLPHDVLGRVLHGAHAEASQIIAKLWKLPDDLQLVLAYHHRVTISGYAHPAAAVVAVSEQLASELCARLNLSAPSWDTTNSSSLLAARQALGFDEGALDRLREQAEPIVVQLAAD
jgi:HD-like signal output (HDOD) protein